MYMAEQSKGVFNLFGEGWEKVGTQVRRGLFYEEN